ncbi:hypothetical protein LINPERPRIM_LOCUS31691, partial [Linum perenne]
MYIIVHKLLISKVHKRLIDVNTPAIAATRQMPLYI